MVHRKIATALTIAGSDSCGGAGIQADLKTFTAFRVYGESCITAVTAQNTQGVFAVHPVPEEIILAQLDAVFTDIVPDTVKIGMLGSAEAIHAVAAALRKYRPHFTVLDPVFISTSGTALLSPDAVEVLVQELMPLVTLVTPNLPEAMVLMNTSITTQEDMEHAAHALAQRTGASVLLKGGHFDSARESDDLLLQESGLHWFRSLRVDNPNTHGTGCTLSAAIAASMAQGKSLEAAVQQAKDYISDAIAWGLDLGKGNGPLYHMIPQCER